VSTVDLTSTVDLNFDSGSGSLFRKWTITLTVDPSFDSGPNFDSGPSFDSGPELRQWTLTSTVDPYFDSGP
jgi:hypothetical protein